MIIMRKAMELVVLGSGSSSPHISRSSSAYWLETSSGSILLDCSASSIHRMAQEKLDWANLDSIWISHFHLDHFGGLEPFLFGTKYALETQNRKKPMKIFGAEGLRRLIEAVDQTNNYGLLEQPFPLEIIEIRESDAFEILPGIEAAAFSTPHTPESHAIRITDENGGSLVFTADTGYTETFRGFAANTGMLIMECSFFKDKPTEKHLEFAEVMHLARQIRPKKLMLTHFYAEWDEIDLLDEAAKYELKFEVIEAKDGLRVAI